MIVIGITGQPRSGKDTFAEVLVSKYNFVKMAFADPLKDAAAILLNRPRWQCNGEQGFDREAPMPEWGFSMRWFLQIFGTECLRNQVDPDFWLTHMKNRIDKQIENFKGWQEGSPFGKGGQFSTRGVVISDLRFENEAKMIRDMGGHIFKVQRGTEKASTHLSDAGIKLTINDPVLLNSGSLERFHGLVEQIAKANGWDQV